MNEEETIKAAGVDEAAADANISQEVPFKDYFMVSLTSGLGYGFDAYAVNIYGLVLPAIAASLGASASLMGFIGSIQLTGYMLGTIIFGVAADKFGRKDTLGASILLYGVTTTLGGLSHNIPFFAAMRFLTGLGGAGELAVGAPYTAEMWPAKFRAIGTGGIIFSLYSLGYITAGLGALYILPRFGWEWAFIIAIVPAIGVFAMRLLLQESVRYVIQRTDNKVAAAKALAEAEHGDNARDRVKAIDEIARQGGNVDEKLWHVPGLTGPGEKMWDIPGVKKRIGIGWLLYTANAVGYWSLSVFLTTVLINQYGLSPSRAIVYAIGFYVVQFFFSFLGTGLADWLGRRPIGILGAVIMMIVTVFAATAEELNQFMIWGALMIAMLGWLWAVGDTYIAELFPTRIRGSAFGISIGGGRAVAIFAPFLVGIGIDTFGGATIPFLITAGLWVMTIIGYAIGPETAGKELEEIEAEMVRAEAEMVRAG